MKEYLSITDKEKWQAVISCDKGYDGIFLYGVKTTGIYCRPSCKAKAPARKNVFFFNNSTEAAEAGYRPCKRCRPDKAAFDPNMELVNKAKGLIEERYTCLIEAGKVAKEVGVSTSHLTRLFKKHQGTTPTYYINELRINKASELLENTDAKVLEIAYATGFRSLSSFYKCFKQQTGKTPIEYRESRGEL
jgi:AraC family transcriptional regulator of adaptative response / methylphosphotriester-DNA alkyltransferase methyltransferase